MEEKRGKQEKKYIYTVYSLYIYVFQTCEIYQREKYLERLAFQWEKNGKSGGGKKCNKKYGNVGQKQYLVRNMEM